MLLVVIVLTELLKIIPLKLVPAVITNVLLALPLLIIAYLVLRIDCKISQLAAVSLGNLNNNILYFFTLINK